VKKLIALAALVLATVMTGAAAQQATEKPKQDPKAEAKAPAGVAGKWILTVETQNGTMNPTLDLKVDGKKVTGTLTSQQGETQVAGEFAENKLTFSLNIQSNGGEMKIDFAGTLKTDGTLAGTMAFPQGEIPWTAARPK
jgi:hypothetical protein